MRVGRKSGGGAALTLIAVLAACSSQARSNAAVGHSVAAPAVHPVSGLPVIDLAVIHGIKAPGGSTISAWKWRVRQRRRKKG